MQQPRDITRPEPGYFRMRLVKGGPWVAARIWRPCHCSINGAENDLADSGFDVHEWLPTCDRFGPLAAECNGKEVEPGWVWERGQHISEHEYKFLVQDAAWAKAHAPDDPMANPTKPIDLNALPPLF